MGSHLLSDCQNTEEGNASECLTPHIPNLAYEIIASPCFDSTQRTSLDYVINLIINVNPNVNVNVDLGA